MDIPTTWLGKLNLPVLKVTNDLNVLTLENNMNEPEFFWSPHWGINYNLLPNNLKVGLTASIKDFLQSVPCVPRLWLDV
jgi:hypothetical protein